MTGDRDAADLYLRKSNDDQGKSAARQESECTADATEQGWTVGRVFADPDRSASRYAKKPRPDYDALVEHIRTGRCKVLVVWEVSRGTRRVGEGDALLNLCREHGVLIRVTSNRRTYDVKRRGDWRNLIDEVVSAADESEKTSERSLSGHRGAAAAGLPTGQVAYGYTRLYDERRKFAGQPEHPEQGAVVRRIFAAVDAGTPLTTLARMLTAEGVPAPEGGIWRSTTIRKLATNPRYIGQRVHLGVVVATGQWPALVDAEQFERVQARLSDPARVTQRGTELKWVLSGVPRCGRCRVGRLRTWRQAGGARRYLCGGCKGILIQAEPLDALIIELVLARVSVPGVLERLRATESSTGEVAAARRELKELKQQLDEYRELVTARKLSPAGLVPFEAAILPQIAATQERLRSLSLPSPLAGLGDDAQAWWDDLSVAGRRGAVLALVDLEVGPAVKGRNAFDPTRLGESRWVGSDRTWAEEWADTES